MLRNTFMKNGLLASAALASALIVSGCSTNAVERPRASREAFAPTETTVRGTVPLISSGPASMTTAATDAAASMAARENRGGRYLGPAAPAVANAAPSGSATAVASTQPPNPVAPYVPGPLTVNSSISSPGVPAITGGTADATVITDSSGITAAATIPGTVTATQFPASPTLSSSSLPSPNVASSTASFNPTLNSVTLPSPNAGAVAVPATSVSNSSSSGTTLPNMTSSSSFGSGNAVVPPATVASGGGGRSIGAVVAAAGRSLSVGKARSAGAIRVTTANGVVVMTNLPARGR